MKNLILLSSLFIALSVSAQDVSSVLRKGGSFEGLNKQRDTLIASGTVDYVIELGDDVFGVLTIAIESDEVSGTSAYDSYLFQSNNGIDWGIAVDTITHTGGGDNYEEFRLVNGSRNYYKVSTVATAATQKSLLKAWGRLTEGFIIENE